MFDCGDRTSRNNSNNNQSGFLVKLRAPLCYVPSSRLRFWVALVTPDLARADCGRTDVPHNPSSVIGPKPGRLRRGAAEKWSVRKLNDICNPWHGRGDGHGSSLVCLASMGLAAPHFMEHDCWHAISAFAWLKLPSLKAVRRYIAAVLGIFRVQWVNNASPT